MLVIILDDPLAEAAFAENDRKFAARCLLADNARKILIPSADEWIGVNLLERDDMLVRKPDVSCPMESRREATCRTIRH